MEKTFCDTPDTTGSTDAQDVLILQQDVLTHILAKEIYNAYCFTNLSILAKEIYNGYCFA